MGTSQRGLRRIYIAGHFEQFRGCHPTRTYVQSAQFQSSVRQTTRDTRTSAKPDIYTHIHKHSVYIRTVYILHNSQRIQCMYRYFNRR